MRSTSSRSQPPAAQTGIHGGTIAIGFITVVDSGGGFSALGLNPVDFGDNKTQVEALVRYMNAHGGIDGRRIVPVITSWDFAKSEVDLESQVQAVCADLTQDHHVFAAVTYVNFDDPQGSALSCLARAHTILINDAQEPLSSQVQPRFDYFYAPSDFTADRMVATYGGGLARGGFFGKTPKIGVVIGAGSQYYMGLLHNDLEPALAAYGYRVADVAAYSSGGNVASDSQEIAFRFETEHITHVLVIGTNPVFFMQAAAAQHYHPKYGLNSALAPGSFLQTAAPSGQLTGAVAVGWLPVYDVDAGQDPGPLSRTQTLCNTIERDAGQDQGRVAEFSADGYCDGVFFLAQALHNSRETSAAAVAHGYTTLAGHYLSTVTFRSVFEPSRHDGAAAYRLDVYHGSCNCFEYSGPYLPTD